ncbi:hypothetical protein [Corallincola spongiicola]|uniref:PEP-CTERM sorting domain-containing protein n=1 Tax=Corallincola spongiicola TaxID=2520508 RepID=A0ABY1WRS0_9GAMM|nr:hypothetical protein [Corallincola spongiicola]TAA47437.1 hypothetical protein EXY25_09440 [Corallincola spongiicola]
MKHLLIALMAACAWLSSTCAVAAYVEFDFSGSEAYDDGSGAYDRAVVGNLYWDIDQAAIVAGRAAVADTLFVFDAASGMGTTHLHDARFFDFGMFIEFDVLMVNYWNASDQLQLEYIRYEVPIGDPYRPCVEGPFTECFTNGVDDQDVWQNAYDQDGILESNYVTAVSDYADGAHGWLSLASPWRDGWRIIDELPDLVAKRVPVGSVLPLFALLALGSISLRKSV